MANNKLLKNTTVSMILMCLIFMSIASDLATAREVRVTETNTLPASREHITQTREQCKAACVKWCLYFSGIRRDACFGECTAQCPDS